MNDKELNRRFAEVDKRFDRVENTKPGEPALGSGLDKTLRQIEGNTADIKVDIGTLKERVDNHIRFFWGACAVFFALFLAAGGYIYSQQGRLSSLEATLRGRLASLEAALPTAQLVNAISGTVNEQKIQTIQRVITEAKRTGARIEPEALSNTSRYLVQSSAKADPSLNDAAWKTVREIVDYRTTLNVLSLPLVGPVQSPGQSALKTHYYFNYDKSKPTISVVGSASIDESAILERIGSGLNKSLPMGNQHVIAEGGDVIIDGLEMKKVIFQGVKIIYRGGPIKMNDVYFVNCIFEFPQDQRGQDLAFAVLQSPSTTFSAS